MIFGKDFSKQVEVKDGKIKIEEVQDLIEEQGSFTILFYDSSNNTSVGIADKIRTHVNQNNKTCYYLKNKWIYHVFY